MKTAIQILEKHWDRTLPIDPEAIAVRLGIEVRADSGLGPISGKFEMLGKNPVITYNSSERNLRQRFTIAHELGHFVLGHGSAFRDTSDAFSTAQYDQKEIEANRFAAELLMPKVAVDQMIKKQDVKDFSRLAEIFQVSEVAMKYRLKNTGWI